MTGAERLRRHRALRGRKPDPNNAAYQQRWRNRQAAKRAAQKAARALEPAAPDLLLVRAVAILEARGEADLLRKLRVNWPYIEPAARQQMAGGSGFKFWLRDG
jgi:hypothetical protein